MFLFHCGLLIPLDLQLVFLENSEEYESLTILLKYEYILMLIFAVKSLVEFTLHVYEKLFHYGIWENKTLFIGIVEFLYNFITFSVVITEFIILSKRSALGIYFIDKSFRAAINMWKFLSGYIESRKLLSRVDMFPEATDEEIHKASDKCIFCLDQLTKAKRINCGHLFHYKCLRGYFENSSNPKCPTCRADINEKAVPAYEHTETISQNLASSFLLQDLPNHVKPLGKALDIGSLSW